MALILDHLADGLRDEFREQLADIAVGGLTFHNVDHLLSDLLRLRGLGVAGDLNLVRSFLGEADGEHANNITVGGLDLGTGLNESLPLLDQRLHFIRGERHGVEVGEDGFSLDILGDKVDGSVGTVLILVEVGKGHTENTSLQVVDREY